MTTQDGLHIILQALEASLLSPHDRPDHRAQEPSRLKNEIPSTTWIKSSGCLIGIGNRVDNIATMAAFVTNGSNFVFSEAHKRFLEVGLTYTDQLLHERSSLGREDKHPKLQDIILSSISFGLAAVDQCGAVNYITENSRKWLGMNDELHVQNGCISAKRPRNQALLHDALVQATNGGRKTTIIRIGSIGDALKVITVMPISETPHLALLVLGQKYDGDKKIRDELLGMLGLTVAERKLTQHLLAGKSLNVAAKECNLTVSTARSYLKTIFAKTGTHRQSELIMLYHDLLPPVRYNKGAPRKNQGLSTLKSRPIAARSLITPPSDLSGSTTRAP